jgi:hypothetical protein
MTIEQISGYVFANDLPVIIDRSQLLSISSSHLDMCPHCGTFFLYSGRKLSEISHLPPGQLENFMMNKPLKIISRYGAIVVLCATALLLVAHTVAASEKVNTTFFGVAIKGYDTVAYHTEGRALKGSSKISHKWNDAKWYFVSEANRDLFIKEPDRYAPQYGGY